MSEVDNSFHIRGAEIYPSPPIEGAVPPTRRVLEALLEQSPHDPAILFSLGNVLLRSGNLAEAVQSFSRALEFAPHDPKLLVNLAVTNLRLSRVGEALRLLKTALLKDPSCELALFHLSQAYLEQGELAAAEELLRKLAAINPTSQRALQSLAEVIMQGEGGGDAADIFRRAIQAGADVRVALARLLFSEGAKLFDEKRYLEAIKSWSAAARETSPVFNTDQSITTRLKEYRQQLQKDKLLERYYKKIDDSRIGEVIQIGAFLSQLPFELFPVPGEDVGWRDSLKEDSAYHYARYRLALSLAFDGQLEEALELIDQCRDKIPRKKHEQLRLGEMRQLLAEILERVTAAREGRVPRSSIEDWQQQGFSLSFELNRWRKSGLLPEEAARWRDAGFKAREAADWKKLAVPLEEAKLWKGEGFLSAKRARLWLRSAITPAQAKGWEQTAMSQESAVQWISAGFREPAEAEEWAKEFSLPWEAERWRSVGFSAAEAREYRRSGVYEAAEALKISKIDMDDS